VSTKDGVIKNAGRRLLQAKKLIADLTAEVQSLCSYNNHPEPEQQTPQQWSEAEIGHMNSHSLSSIHRDHAGSVKELEATCRRRLRSYLPLMANLWREGKLLPLKFDEQFYAE